LLIVLILIEKFQNTEKAAREELSRSLEKEKEAESAQGLKIKELEEKVELGVENLHKAKVQVRMRCPLGNLDLRKIDAYRCMPKDELALYGKFFLYTR
jgi:hypothetical protein